ncbi:MAG: hypothetical protein LBM65_02295 [Oscillospiraceae bacterium]|jgi:hypothetical protein|nr:hypothetical protein [Oscillospiraceae bacterium]
MTLILTALAATVTIVFRFAKQKTAEKLRLGLLALMYSGAALMWTVDGFAAMFAGEPFVELQNPSVVADDAFLGICVLFLGAAIWAVGLIFKKATKKAV